MQTRLETNCWLLCLNARLTVLVWPSRERHTILAGVRESAGCKMDNFREIFMLFRFRTRTWHCVDFHLQVPTTQPCSRKRPISGIIARFEHDSETSQNQPSNKCLQYLCCWQWWLLDPALVMLVHALVLLFHRTQDFPLLMAVY